MLEKAIESRVVAWAKKKGFLAVKVKFNDNGYPDRLFISRKGHTIFIEFKVPGEIPEPLQEYRITELQTRGIPAYWTDNYDDAILILSAALEPEKLPEESGQASIRAGVRRALLRPRPGENQYRLSGPENSLRERDDPEGPNYSADLPDV